MPPNSEAPHGAAYVKFLAIDAAAPQARAPAGPPGRGGRHGRAGQLQHVVAPVYTYYWTAYQTLLERGYHVDFTMVRMKRGKQETTRTPATSCSTTGADAVGGLTPGFATAEATARYRARVVPDAVEGHFRSWGGLSISSVGLGTYLGAEDGATDGAYHDAVMRAVERGLNVIDSAVNYRHQRSERSIGAALRSLIAGGISERREVLLTTKGGFIPSDGAMPADWSAYVADTYVRSGICAARDIVADSHCLTPRFLSDQLDRSRANLGGGDHRRLLRAQPGDAAHRGGPPHLPRAHARGVSAPRGGGGRRQDPVLRHRDLERLSAAAIGAGLPVTRGPRAHRARDRRRSAPLPRRPGPLQPRDDRSLYE